jgi:hypothetical protein
VFAFVDEKNLDVIKRHGTTMKIIDAQQAKLRKNLQKHQAKVTKDKCGDLVQRNMQNQEQT